MTRTLRTLLLSAAALGALATAAAAAPSTPLPLDGAPTGMGSMHAAGTTQMHTNTGSMAAMHTAMSADREVHDAMLDDPAMQAHMAEYGLDLEQQRQWHATGTSVAQIHEMLAEQGIDVDAMSADCPMLTSMGSMHRDGALHNTPEGDGS